MAKYVAEKMCFIDGRRIREGEVFELPDDIPVADYMKPVATNVARKQKGRDPETLSEISKADSKALGKTFI